VVGLSSWNFKHISAGRKLKKEEKRTYANRRESPPGRRGGGSLRARRPATGQAGGESPGRESMDQVSEEKKEKRVLSKNSSPLELSRPAAEVTSKRKTSIRRKRRR